MQHRKKNDEAVKRLNGLAGNLAHLVLHELQRNVQERHGFGVYRFRYREAEPMFGFSPEDTSIHMRVAGVIFNRRSGYMANLEIDAIINREDDWEKLSYSSTVMLTLFENDGEALRYKFEVPAPGEHASVKLVEVKQLEEIEIGQGPDDDDLSSLEDLIEHLVDESPEED